MIKEDVIRAEIRRRLSQRIERSVGIDAENQDNVIFTSACLVTAVMLAIVVVAEVF